MIAADLPSGVKVVNPLDGTTIKIHYVVSEGELPTHCRIRYTDHKGYQRTKRFPRNLNMEIVG